MEQGEIAVKLERSDFVCIDSLDLKGSKILLSGFGLKRPRGVVVAVGDDPLQLDPARD